MTIGLIGYGAFGRLIYPYLAADFAVRVYDPALDAGHARFSRGLAEVAACDVVIIASPVQAMNEVAAAIAPWLRPGTLVLDVGSVKVIPARILTEALPSYVDLICTHPLFGPQSAREGLHGLKIVLCPIRGRRLRAVRRWLQKLSLTVMVTSPDDHDREMALSQGITHLIAKVIADIAPTKSELTTPSFDLLLQATEMVRYDAPAVFKAIERTNPYSSVVRKRFFELAEQLKRQLEVDE